MRRELETTKLEAEQKFQDLAAAAKLENESLQIELETSKREATVKLEELSIA